MASKGEGKNKKTLIKVSRKKKNKIFINYKIKNSDKIQSWQGCKEDTLITLCVGIITGNKNLLEGNLIMPKKIS